MLAISSLGISNMPSDQRLSGSQLKRALELCRKEAEQGRDSFFDRWWYFDTNCVSELVKLSLSGHSVAVRDFVRGKDILVSSTTVQELRKAPNILQSVLVTLDTANVYLAPDITRFWYTDILNFLNVERIPINSLQVYPLQPSLLGMVTDARREEFEQACFVSERNVAQQFFDKIYPDIGANLDERDLCIYIYNVVNDYGREWFDIDIPPADSHPANFPSFYVFFYAYYFRYVKNKDVRPELNDFIDLANCLAATYSERFYCEATFATILRNYVQGRKPPVAFQLMKKLYKKGLIDTEVYRAQRKNKSMLNRTAPLLEHTEIFNFTEMRSQITQNLTP
jgi:hypothetical protein